MASLEGGDDAADVLLFLGGEVGAALFKQGGVFGGALKDGGAEEKLGALLGLALRGVLVGGNPTG